MKRRESFGPRLAKASRRLWRWFHNQFLSDSVVLSLLILLISTFIVYVAYQSWPAIQAGFWPGVFIEFTGMLFDVIIFGVLIALFARGIERRRDIKRQQEVIDDYKKWNSDEAKYRIAGAIRRLVAMGKTDIDMNGIVLKGFDFPGHDIWTIEGSAFNTGLRLDAFSKNEAILDEVNFANVNCSDVVFSRSSGLGAFGGLTGKNLNFALANLENANFEGAKLSWTNFVENKDDWYETDEDPDGRPFRIQNHYPAFQQANLSGCSFKHAELSHADFRDSDNILEADFTGAKGLETCFFDEVVREGILRQGGGEKAA